MDEICIYEGMRAVCAVLAELETGAVGRPALRLAERHLHLLADLAAAALPAGSTGNGGPAQPLANTSFRAPANGEGCHVLQ